MAIIANSKEMCDRIAKLEQHLEIFRRNKDLDDSKDATNLKSSYLLHDSKPFSTLDFPWKPPTVSSIQSGGSGTPIKPCYKSSPIQRGRIGP